MKKKAVIFIVIVITLTACLMIYPKIEINTGSKLIKLNYSGDFSDYDINHSYNELYCYNEKHDVSIRSFDVKKFLFFYVIHMDYINGDFRETQFILEESYIENFLNNAEITENKSSINLAELINGKTAVVSNTRYLGNDYNSVIVYKLDGKYEEMYVFNEGELLIIQVGSPDELPKFIAYK